MLGQKKKISRKEIKEDRLVTFYYEAIALFEEHKKNILIGAGALAVIILAFVLYTNNKMADNEIANVELGRVISLYDSGSFMEAIEGKPGTNVIGFKKIVEMYGSTENGEIAKIYLANSYYALGKFDEAEIYYDDYSGGIDLFKSTALAGLAACKEAKDDFKSAAELYMKAAKITEENVLNPKYLVLAGINLLHSDNKSQAKEIFTQVKKDFAKSAYIREVDRYLSQSE
ncbi:MAG TPA: tetratricopeptide repeat protein [Ignavibacteriaceae bacterium]|nr:tetratricopeptide repeat protein [Ignavibacteriaceae bacterium]